MQVDVGFGDIVVPSAVTTEFPPILDFEPPRLFGYTRASLVAEKFESMVHLGLVNSRMKDFFDLFVMAERFEFDGALLCRAIEATFSRRRTPVPENTPTGLSAEFARDDTKRVQWRAFLTKGRLDSQKSDFGEVVSFVREFLMPPAEAIAKGEEFGLAWRSGGPWGEPEK